MKLSFKHLLSAALLMAMPLTFTSCEGALDDIFGEWSRPGSEDPYVLSAALKEGALVSYTIIENGVEKVITFKRVGNEYVLISPASTRSYTEFTGKYNLLGAGTIKGYTSIDNEDDDDGWIIGDDVSLLFTAKADDGTTALKAETKIKDGSTQVAKYNENYGVAKITLNSQKYGFGNLKEIFSGDNQAYTVGPQAVLQYGEPGEPNYKTIDIDIPNVGKTSWLEYKNLLQLSTDKSKHLFLTMPFENDEGVVYAKFSISYKDNYGDLVSSKLFDVVEVQTYFLTLVE